MSAANFEDTNGIIHSAVPSIQKLPYDTAAISIKHINELRKVDLGRFLRAISCTLSCVNQMPDT